MRTIFIVAGIVLAGATIITVVQNDKKKDVAPEVQQAGDGNGQPAKLPATPSVASSINPAHGVVGHRCDLPVGAPLNSASATEVPVQNPPTINMNPGPAQPATVSPSPAPVPSSSGLKINPAHGLPGHRCDIQVGAPLS